MIPSLVRRAYRARTVASETPSRAAMRRNDSRPFACSSSMMRRSSSSTLRAGATGPRGVSSCSAVNLRNARDSYQEPTHCVNGVDRGGPNAENPESVARTPLMRAVRRLAAEHQAAEQLGIEVAELRGQRISRRELARRGGMAAAALALPAALAKPARSATTPRIAIVGAGIAGLNAALTLADAGYASTPYEASTDRVGGRMHSDTSGYWDKGQVSEFCGELIDTGHKTIRRLARRFNLQTDDLLAAEPAGSSDTYYFFGSSYPVAQADGDFQQITGTLKHQLKAAGYPTTYNSSTQTGQMLDHMSVYDWIEQYVPGGHSSQLGRLLDAAYADEYGADTTDQASLNLLYLLAYQPKGAGFSIFGQSDERFHISGGNQQLPEAIANYLGRQTINMGWALQSIKTTASGVALTFATPGRARTVVADHVILCMSFSVLRTLDYSGANFDNLKKTAIAQLGSGHNSKLQLQFTSRLWNAQGSNGNVYSDNGFQNAWDVSRAQSGSTGILVDYGGGSYADSFSPS